MSAAGVERSLLVALTCAALLTATSGCGGGGREVSETGVRQSRPAQQQAPRERRDKPVAESVDLPELTAIDVRKGLRPHPLPGPGDLISAAGPVQTGSYGQSQIHALELHVAGQ